MHFIVLHYTKYRIPSYVSFFQCTLAEEDMNTGGPAV